VFPYDERNDSGDSSRGRLDAVTLSRELQTASPALVDDQSEKVSRS